MNMDDVVKVGSEPWLPHAQASDLRVIHVDDLPQAGFFRLHDHWFAFLNLCEAGDASVWGYVPVDSHQAELLTKWAYGSAWDVFTNFASIFPGQKAVLALAIESGIKSWEPVLVGDRVTRAAVEFLDRAARAPRPQLVPSEDCSALVRELETVGI